MVVGALTWLWAQGTKPCRRAASSERDGQEFELAKQQAMPELIMHAFWIGCLPRKLATPSAAEPTRPALLDCLR